MWTPMSAIFLSGWEEFLAGFPVFLFFGRPSRHNYLGIGHWQIHVDFWFPLGWGGSRHPDPGWGAAAPYSTGAGAPPSK